MIAYTSQLAHVLSSAYIQNPLSTAYSGFTGGSFQDLTRVARLNCDMWGELFDRNRDLLCQQLDVLIELLGEYRTALENRMSRPFASSWSAAPGSKTSCWRRDSRPTSRWSSAGG